MSIPLLSVRMSTYNQEKYIGMAIESVIKQKVNFRYELLIGEDASTDTTADIVDRYQKKYPDIIKVYHRKKNIGMKKNGRLLMKHCRGKYVAVLEGDDYWISDTKLQTQVDYLEAHKDVIATAHNVLSVDQEGKELDAYFVDFPLQKRHIYSSRNAVKGELLGHLSSVVYRNIRYLLDINQWESFLHSNLNGDLKLSITLGMLGKVVYFEEPWSCRRRVVAGDSWSAGMLSRNLFFFYFCNYLEVEEYLKSCFGVKTDISPFLSDIFRKANILAIKSPTRENRSVAGKVNAAYMKFLFSHKFKVRIKC